MKQDDYQILQVALDFAAKTHAADLKKKTSVPYIFHPLAVASYVLQFGGDFNQAAAGAIHDTISEGREVYFLDLFGKDVTELAFSFLDPEGTADLPWESLKSHYLAKIRQVDVRALLVIACEELHDCRSLNLEVRMHGQEIWERYPVDPSQVMWYYQELLKIFRSKLQGNPLVEEFAQAVADLRSLE
ncbi:MAG: HD domain-containing protein [Bacteriovoracaceae bacterium]